jgi:hypothetical protein
MPLPYWSPQLPCTEHKSGNVFVVLLSQQESDQA